MSSHPGVEDLSTYLDNSLPSRQSQRVEAHLALCRSCRKRAEAMQGVIRQLASLERHTPPPSLGFQIKRLSALQAERLTLAERIEQGASRFGPENALVPMFGVVVALIVIIYLLSWGFARHSQPGAARGFQSDGPSSTQPVDSGTSILEAPGPVASRRVAGRMFDLVGSTWTERGLEEAGEVERLSADDPRARQWLDEHPEAVDLSEVADGIRLRLGQRIVEIRFDSVD